MKVWPARTYARRGRPPRVFVEVMSMRRVLVGLLVLQSSAAVDAAKKKKKAGHDTAADEAWLEEKGKEEGVLWWCV